MRRWIVNPIRLVGGLALGIAALVCIPVKAESPKPVLVELFTSEGCSSCPPADALLRTLDSTQPVSGVQLIVLGEHVDYWDDLGWKDTYSSHALTLRQGSYARNLHISGPYTPQMVVDGNIQFSGGDIERAEQAFQKARSLPKVSVRISSVKVEKGAVLAHLETDALPGKAEVFVALCLDRGESQVLRGENGGHRLEHVSIVRNLTKVGEVKNNQVFSKDLKLGVDSPEKSYRLIAFVQQSNQGRILGAAVEHVGK